MMHIRDIHMQHTHTKPTRFTMQKLSENQSHARMLVCTYTTGRDITRISRSLLLFQRTTKHRILQSHPARKQIQCNDITWCVRIRFYNFWTSTVHTSITAVTVFIASRQFLANCSAPGKKRPTSRYFCCSRAAATFADKDHSVAGLLLH
jgi:hypothetical protein